MSHAASMSLAQLTERFRPQIEAALATACRSGDGCPAKLGEAMAYSLLAPGKRLRPLLVLLAAEACEGDALSALPAACAVEMVHAYSLIHDDLPAMDDDDLRRGRPTNHVVFGEAMAILAGDALLTRAFEVLAKEIDPPATAAACCATLATAAGACHLVGGQADDIDGLEAVSGDSGLAQLESIHKRKTGALIRASLRLGALTADANPTELAALDDYGGRLGLAFQITDDVLDAQGCQAETGKRVGKDEQAGKLTYPGLLGVEDSLRLAERLIDEACRALPALPAHTEALESLARYVLERNR